MKRQNALLIGAMLLLLVFGNGCGSRGTGVTLTPEQQRLQKIALIFYSIGNYLKNWPGNVVTW